MHQFLFKSKKWCGHSPIFKPKIGRQTSARRARGTPKLLCLNTLHCVSVISGSFSLIWNNISTSAWFLKNIRLQLLKLTQEEISSYKSIYRQNSGSTKWKMLLKLRFPKTNFFIHCASSIFFRNHRWKSTIFDIKKWCPPE